MRILEENALFPCLSSDYDASFLTKLRSTHPDFFGTATAPPLTCFRPIEDMQSGNPDFLDYLSLMQQTLLFSIEQWIREVYLSPSALTRCFSVLFNSG